MDVHEDIGGSTIAQENAMLDGDYSFIRSAYWNTSCDNKIICVYGCVSFFQVHFPPFMSFYSALCIAARDVPLATLHKSFTCL